MLQPVGTGHYDSLQTQLQRRFSAGFALTVNYTYGKAVTPLENSDAKVEAQALSYMTRNYAPAWNDRTHNLAITNIWQLPFGGVQLHQHTPPRRP
jgi:hypothetical protein